MTQAVLAGAGGSSGSKSQGGQEKETRGRVISLMSSGIVVGMTKLYWLAARAIPACAETSGRAMRQKHHESVLVATASVARDRGRRLVCLQEVSTTVTSIVSARRSDTERDAATLTGESLRSRCQAKL